MKLSLQINPEDNFNFNNKDNNNTNTLPSNPSTKDSNNNNNNNNNNNSKNLNEIKIKNISFLRFFLLFFFLFSGFFCSFISFYYLSKHSQHSQHISYISSIEDNLKYIKYNLHLKLQMNLQNSLRYSLYCPNLSTWPYCMLPSKSYVQMSKLLSTATNINQFVYLPIVKNENKVMFENYIKNQILKDGNYPPNTGVSSFGSVIYEYNENFQRIPSVNHSMYVPIIQLSNLTYGASESILENIYTKNQMKSEIDQILNCVSSFQNQYNHLSNNIEVIQSNCSIISTFIQDNTDITVISSPIFPYSDPSKIVGFSVATFSWETILSSTINFDSNFFCIINTGSQRLYFKVDSGNVKQTYTDDYIHRYEKHGPHQGDHDCKRTFLLNNVLEFSLLNDITITYYPVQDERVEITPIIVCVCCITATILICIMFLIFDYFLSRESETAQSLLDSKRLFVRFISHEIRTPLNTIILGLKLLDNHLNEIKKIKSTLSSSVLLQQIDENRSNSNKSNENETENENEKLFDDCFDLIRELNENTLLAVSTLNDLLNYDKIETNKFEIEKKKVNIISVVEKTLSPLCLHAKEKDVKLIVKTDDYYESNDSNESIDVNNLRVIGDAFKLGQVLRNIVSNALKFTPVGGTVSVSVGFSPTQNIIESIDNIFKTPSIVYGPNSPVDAIGQVVIKVTDTGPGLSADQLNLLFGEGVQFNPNQLQAGQGSGLGLWISKEIINLHQGTIKVYSDGLGYGSTFEILLPVQYKDSVDLPSFSVRNNLTPKYPKNVSTQLQTPSQLPSSLSTPEYYQTYTQVPSETKITTTLPVEHHVLVVDDAPSNRKLVCRLLKSKGFICHEAENGLKCLEALKSRKQLQENNQFEFILLDYEMPELNGPLTAQKIRESGDNILIIGITGNVLPEDTSYFLEHGANAVYPKPVDIERILDKINDLKSNV